MRIDSLLCCLVTCFAQHLQAVAFFQLLQFSLWQTFRLADLLLLRITIITRHRLALRSNWKIMAKKSLRWRWSSAPTEAAVAALSLAISVRLCVCACVWKLFALVDWLGSSVCACECVMNRAAGSKHARTTRATSCTFDWASVVEMQRVSSMLVVHSIYGQKKKKQQRQRQR